MRSKLGILVLTFVVGAVYSIHDPSYTGIKTKAYQRDPQIAQAFQKQQEYDHEQNERQRFTVNQYEHATNYHSVNGDDFERLSLPSSSSASSSSSRALEENRETKPLLKEEKYYERNMHQIIHHETPIFDRYITKIIPPTPTQSSSTIPPSPPSLPSLKNSVSVSGSSGSSRSSSSNWDDAENVITEYYTGCPKGFTGQLPYLYDCRRFLNCWNGRGHIQSCAPGTVFNPDTLECDRPDKVLCGTLGTTSAHFSHVGRDDSRYARLLSTEHHTPESQSDLCPKGVIGLHPHPADCTKFLNCANDKVHIQSCGPGTAYNIPMMLCDFKDAVDCSGREGIDAVRTDGLNAHDHKKNGPHPHDLRKTIDIFCPDGVTGLFPYPFDHGKFMNCKHGNTAIQNCIPGTLFSISRSFCSPKNKIDANDRVSSSISDVNYDYSHSVVTCPPGMYGLYLYPYDCHKYLNCLPDRSMELLSCEVGMIYSYADRRCVWEQEALSGTRVGKYEGTVDISGSYGSTYANSRGHSAAPPPLPPPSSLPSATFSSENTIMVTCPPGGSGFHPYPFDCTRYLRCQNGKIFIDVCTAGTVFSLTKNRCEPKEMVNDNERVAYSSENVQHNRRDEEQFMTIHSQTLLPPLESSSCPPGVEGLFLHPFDCTAYFRCSNGKKFIEYCPTGSVFSISRQMCLEMNRVRTSDRVAFSAVNHQSHGGNPSVVYGTSSYAQSQPDSPSGQHNVFKQHQNANSRTFEHSSNDGKMESHGYRNTFEGNYQRGEIACPPQFNGLLSHPRDCTKFLNCINGIPYVQNCAPYTAWNQTMKSCTLTDHPNCVSSPRATTSDFNSDSMVSETQQSNRWGSTHYNAHSPVTCAPLLNGVYPHPFDCTKYLNCRDGQTIIQTCITGTVFSISKRSCVLKESIQKLDRASFMHEYGSGNQERDEETKTVKETIVYDMQKITCPPGALGLYLHPFDCSKYLRCKGGQIMVYSCPEGRVFSLSKKYCVDRNEVDRNDRVEYLNESDENTDREYAVFDPTLPSGRDDLQVECPPDFNGILPHPSVCTKFITCSNGVAYIRDCGPGTAWNIHLQVCDFEDKVDCGDRNPEKELLHELQVKCPEGASGVQPHPYDCKKFLNCANGVTHIQDCGPGTAWNRVMEVCDFEKNVDCKGSNHRESKQYGHSDSATYHASSSTSSNQWKPVTHHDSSSLSPAIPHVTLQQHHPPNRNASHQQTPDNFSQPPVFHDRWDSMGMVRPGRPHGTGGTSENRNYTGYSDNGQRSLDVDWNGSVDLNINPSAHSTSTLEGRDFSTHSHQPNQIVEGHIKPYSPYLPNTPLAPLSKTATTTTSTTTPYPISTTTSSIHYAQQLASDEDSSEIFQNIYGGDLSPIKPSISIVNKSDHSPSALPPLQPGRLHNESPNAEPTTPIPSPSKSFGIYQPPHNDPSDFKSYASPNPSTPTRPYPSTPEGFLNTPVEPTHPLSLTGGQFEEEPESKARVYRIYPSVRNNSSVKFYGDPHYSPSYAEVSHNVHNLGTKNIPLSKLESSSLTTTTTLRSDHRSPPMAPPQEVMITNYNRQYYNPVTLSQSPKPDTAHTDPDMEKLPVSDALRMLLRPYLNRSGTVSEESAARAESHIMNLAAWGKTTPRTTTPSSAPKSTTITTTISQTRNHSEDENQNAVSVELIFTDEQRAMLGLNETRDNPWKTVPTYHHAPSPPRDLKGIYQSVDNKTTWHSEDFHARHPHMPNPFKTGEHQNSDPTSAHQPLHNHHHHHRHHHHYHEELGRSSHTNNPNSLIPDGNSAPIKPVDGIPWNIFRSEVKDKDQNCSFDCGNNKCLKDQEVCDGVFNCDNRQDEARCGHLGYEVRLAGGENSNSGRIEVKVLGKWGYVCDDQFGLLDADVVCKEVGFSLGASEVRGSSFYSPPDTNFSFVMDEVECKGHEKQLRECDFKGWGVNNCSPDEVVGVVCKVPLLKCPNNYWLCSESKECIPPAFVCDNTPDCSDRSDESERVCNSPIQYRLEGGRGVNEGRVEVMYRGEWGSVCDDDFGETEAQVLCNSLGFYGTPKIERNIFGPGSGPIWLDQVSCLGNESSIDKCSHWTWGEHNCNHTEDVGIRCTAGPPPRHRSSTRLTNKRGYERVEKQRSLQDDFATLDDIGLYTGSSARSSRLTYRNSNPNRCGHFKANLYDEYEHPEERVLNGTTAKRGHHPWQATIRTKGRGGISSHWCGAVLISKRHLLTAAHCLVGYPKGAYFIRMGDHYANIAENSETDSYIENWYIHEKFRDKTHMNNDIALIVLKNPVRFNDYIQPVCLPEKRASLQVNRLCTISGWGSIKSGVSTPSNILRAAQLPILSDDTCKQAHVYGNSMTEGMFCAGSMDESVDACDGDSGGPLVCSDEEGETLYGIISWGQQCGFANKPGVYVRVEKYIDWIYEKINFSLQTSGH